MNYADLKYVEQSFNLVNKNIGEVGDGLSEARRTLDEKIDGLESRLTAKIDDQTTSTDKRFKSLDKAIESKLQKQRIDLKNDFENHTDPIKLSIEAVDKRLEKHEEQTNSNFLAIDGRLDQMQRTVDGRFEQMQRSVDERFGRIEQMLQYLLAQSGAPPAAFPPPLPQALPPSSSRPLLTVSPPTSPVAGPSTPRRRSRNPPPAARDAEATNSPESNREPNRDPVLEVFRTIRRQASRGVGLVTKGKERSDQ